MATLTDAGVLFSLTDRNDKKHYACTEALKKLETALISTWPCITEAMYLLGTRLGWKAQDGLWRIIQSGDVLLHDITSAERTRMRQLMAQYRNVPMDLADASLVVAAETRKLRRVFSMDSDFQVYRINDRDSFEIVP